MSQERDPKIDPRAGDVLNSRGQRITVVATSGSTVWFSSSGGLDITEMRIWQSWSRDAEIVRRSSDAT